MKSWKLLPALSCLVIACLGFSPSAASAAGSPPVLFKGLQYSGLGAGAVVVDQADTTVQIHNLGSSGQDGVSVSCPHTDGARLSLAGSSSAATDAGASCAFTYHWTLVSKPAASLATSLSYVVSSNGNHFAADLSGLSSSSTQTVTVTRAGAVVLQVAVPVPMSVSVALDASGMCPNPTLSCARTIVQRQGLAVASVAWPSVVHLQIAGADVDGDGLAFSAPIDAADADCDGVSCDLLVASPPGSGFGTVRCPDGSCRVFDQFVEGAGQAQLDVAKGATTGRRRLQVSNLGSSGQDGVSLVRTPELTDGSGGGGGGSADVHFAPPSLVLDPATDVGSSVALTIVGNAFSSAGLSTPASASLGFTLSSALHLSVAYSPLVASPESVAVLRNGVEVARCALAAGAAVDVSAPPGGPPAFVIASEGKTHTKTGHVTLMKAPMSGVGRVGEAPAASTNPYFRANEMSGTMEVSFRCDRVFVFGGLPAVTGDELVCWGDPACTSGTCASSFVASTTQLRVARSNSSLQLGSLSVDDFTSSDGDVVFADVAGSTALSSAHTCVTVPFRFARVDQTPVRAYSVTFHVSPELAQCGAGVVEGDYLSRVAGTQMFVTDNGGGSYTVDCGILGAVCGATDSGTLFSVAFASAAQPPLSDAGVVTVDAVSVRDCSNAPVAGFPGGSSEIPLQFGAPPPVSSLTATTQQTGNPAGAVAGIVVAAVLAPATPAATVSVDFYARPFGNYPLYDKGSSPGAVPPPPASSATALATGWRHCACSAGSCSAGTCAGACTPTSVVDVPPGRDFFYYVAFVRDLYGNESPASSMTTGTLDYHLGDVSDGLSVCSGDNHVSILDITALGAHYGVRVSPGDAWTCLDVGPTTDFSVNSRPTVDGRIDFEDFMMFAIDFGVVSAPSSSLRPVAAATNASQLVVPPLPVVGQTFDAGVIVDGAGDVQGVSIQLAYDHDVLEQVGVAAGSLLDQQGRTYSVLTSGPGDVDAALLGGGPGITGHGELARVTFRVKSAGDPQLAIASLTARSSDNQAVVIAGAVGGTTIPAHSALGFAYPNPFHESLAFQLGLHATGPASIGIYDVAGRRVRTLVQGVQSAGSRIVTWDGRDDSGLRLAPGAYIVRLEAAGLRESRTVRLVR